MFWADKSTGLSPNFWSRAMGWYLMALADYYELMPTEQKEYKEILGNLWKEAIDGMLEYQDLPIILQKVWYMTNKKG